MFYMANVGSLVESGFKFKVYVPALHDMYQVEDNKLRQSDDIFTVSCLEVKFTVHLPLAEQNGG